MDPITEKALLPDIAWTLVFIIGGLFVLLSIGSFIGSWLSNIRKSTTRALDDTEDTYGEGAIEGDYQALLRNRKDAAP